MSTYNIHAGHGMAGGTGCGAVGILDESKEARKVKDALITYLRSAGHMVHDCTYNGNASAGTILENIVTMCNLHDVDLDISIHLNSGRNDYSGDGSTGGVEVYGYNINTKAVGEAICIGISNALGIRNRGFKTNQSLYVLRKTKGQAVLIECAFVDDADDARAWDADKCARAIFAGLTGKTAAEPKTENNKYAIGQNVTYSTSYPTPTLPCGSQYATGGSGHGVIIGIVSGQAKYKLDNGLYVNDGDIRGLYTAPAPQPVVSYYQAYTGTSTSIVDALKAVGVDSSFANRNSIAAKNGISNYSGTAEQNEKILALLRNGKLIK